MSSPHALTQPAGRTLASLRDHYRPLLVFSPTDMDRRYVRQVEITVSCEKELIDRQVVFVQAAERHDPDADWGTVLNAIVTTSLATSDTAAAHIRFGIAPSDFTVILLGKDGGEKLRSHDPISCKTLRETIDAMPMRQQEMRRP